jgi:hypothetical protein
MVVDRIRHFCCQNSFYVHLMFITDDVDQVVLMVEASPPFPNPLVDVTKAKGIDKFTFVVYFGAHQQEFAVSHFLVAHQLADMVSDVAKVDFFHV